MGRRKRLSGDEGGGGDHDGGGMLRWLLTYADMITLLMAFFIMLYSMSILNLNKFKQVASSIRGGYSTPAGTSGKSILTGSGEFSLKPLEGQNIGVPWEVIKKFQKIIRKQHVEKLVRMRADGRGLIISLVTDKAVFRKGQVDLTPEAEHILGTVIASLKSMPNQILVEGHTCNLPTASEAYPSNWHLSAARASNVACYLIREGIDPQRLTVAGYADSRPLVPNTSERNRAMNRRVDIVVLKTD
jgi:chemotaxis protein MotB